MTLYTKKLYTKNGDPIKYPDSYAKTGAPMYETPFDDTNINAPTHIYKLNLESGKKYVGKTKDVKRRMNEHFSGNGSMVTKKFQPINGKVVDVVPGYLADEAEQERTLDEIYKHGYDNVRGGMYVNSTTLRRRNREMSDSSDPKSYNSVQCFRCGRYGHYANQCYRT